MHTQATDEHEAARQSSAGVVPTIEAANDPGRSKSVEFGLSWGIRRLRGGFLLATMAKDRKDLLDSKYALIALDEDIALFGNAPAAYACCN